MKRVSLLLIIVALLATAGCKPKPADIPPLTRKQAAILVDEAQFAMGLRDYARAEPLFAEATKLCPDDGGYWLGLGVTRRRLGNTAGAKTAYEKARSAFHDAYELDAKRTDVLLQEIYVLALIGKAKDAEALLEKARKKDPNDAQLRVFAENKQLEKMMTDPVFKDIAL
jgi:Flp pilus assembly protein TadD